MVMSAVHALLATMMVGVSVASAIRGPPEPADGDDDVESETDAELEPTSMCRTRKGSGWFGGVKSEPVPAAATTAAPSRKRPPTSAWP